MGLLLLLGGAARPLEFFVEAAFGDNPGASAYTWTDITEPTRAIAWNRGRGDEIFSNVQAGTGTVTLRDDDRDFDPRNAASSYYPDVRPMVPIRAYCILENVTYHLFQHFAERWPRQRIGPNYAERSVPTIDGFALLAAAGIEPEFATLTTAFGSNNDLTFTAADPGDTGNDISIRYEIRAWSTVNVNVIGNDIAVRVNGTSDTAGAVRTALLASSDAMELINVDLAPGSSGAGVVPEMTTTFLAGGGGADLPQEASGSRVTRMLDKAGWSTTARVISTGQAELASETVAAGSDEKVLSHLNDVVADEGGIAFCDARGRYVFIDRHAFITEPYATSQATFRDADGSSGYPYVRIAPSDDGDQIYNEWIGTRDGGIPQIALDETSRERYLRRVKTITSKLSTDNAVRDLVQYGLSRSKDPIARVKALTIMPGNSTALWQTVLNLELGEKITALENPPGGGAEDENEYVIQSLRGVIPAGTANASQFEFGLAPADIENWFIFDHATRGRLDFNKLGR